MRSEKLLKRILEAENRCGLKERYISIFNYDCDNEQKYYFKIDENGQKTFYQNGKEISIDELTSRAEYLVIVNIEDAYQ